MDRSRQSTTWLGWVKALPDEMVRSRPVLSAAYGWAHLNDGELEAAAARLQDAERWLASGTDTRERAECPTVKMVVVDEEEFQYLPATLAAARAYHDLALGDMSGAAMHARRSLDFLSEGEPLRRGVPASLLGLASWARGDLEQADRSLAEAMASFQLAGNVLFAITGTYVLAEIRKALGHLHAALDAFQQSLQLASGQGELVLRGTADVHTGLSELYREQNRLEAAAEELLRSKELGETASLPRWHSRWCVARARLKEAQGDLSGSLDLLDEAERLYVRGPAPDVRPIAALKARVWVAQGKLAEALRWAREQDLSSDDDLSYLQRV